MIADFSLEQIKRLCGAKVLIKTPELKGEIEEIIIDRQRNLLYKIKVWIQGNAFFYVVAPDEIERII